MEEPVHLGAWSIAAVAAVVIGSAGPALAQAVPDCSRAKTAVEKAICGDPKLTEADAAMARAYSALKAKLPAEQQRALLADQRQWVRQRNVRCDDRQGQDLASCLLAQTEARRRFFAGEGPNPATDAPHLTPAFFGEAKKGRYEITIVYPQIAASTGPSAEAFNRAAHAVAFGKDTVAEYRKMEPPRVAGATNFYQASYDITYLDPRFADVVFTVSTFTGGAHPNSGRVSLLFDFNQGKSVKLGDLLAEPKRAVAEIGTQCKSQLQEEATKEGWELFDNADFGAVVGDISNWAVDKDGVDILFDPYSVAAYVVGPRQCRLTYAALVPMLKPNGLLPPK